MMKKSVVVLMVIFAAASAIRAEVTIAQVVACGSNTAAILALLPSAENALQTNMIHYNAICTKAISDQGAFAREIGACERFQRRFAFRSAAPESKERNAALVSYFELGDGQTEFVWLFSPVHATKEECIAFYELVLRSVPLTEKSKDVLGLVKGDLLKLKDLQ